MVRVLQQRITDYDLKEYEMPINQQNGVHTSLADLPLSVPFDSVKHYEDYIARLHQIPRVLNQSTEVLRAGMKDKLMPVRFLLEKIPAQCEGIIEADPFLRPTKKYPATSPPEDQKRLTQQITDAINTDVIPAYKTFADFVRTEYAPAGRTTLSITSLPDGEKRYQNDIYARTTTRMTPDEIHQLGSARNRSHRSRDDGHREKRRLRRSRFIPRFAQDQSEIHSDFSRTNPRRFPAIHRADGAKASRNSSLCFRNRRSPSKPFRRFNPPLPRTTLRARLMASAPGAS